MLTKESAERLKAYFTAKWMDVVEVHTGEGGCDTCGYGAPEYEVTDLAKMHHVIDEFLNSPDNL